MTSPAPVNLWRALVCALASAMATGFVPLPYEAWGWLGIVAQAAVWLVVWVVFVAAIGGWVKATDLASTVTNNHVVVTDEGAPHEG